MKSKWIVFDHHIALETDKEILHPNADEVYSFVNGEIVDIDATNPITELGWLHFSKVGSPIKCDLVSNDNNELVINLYAVRKNNRYPIDIIQGQIIDHCVSGDEWFYINGDIESLQMVLSNAGIEKCGTISVGQYISILKQEFFSAHQEVNNLVKPETVSAILAKRNAVPNGIRAELYEYQKTGYSWIFNMVNAGQGCILGDEMGLGKTLQIITLFENMKENGKKPFLVIVPVSLLENWKRECFKFAPDLDVFVHHGANRTGRSSELIKHDVIVISYNTAVSDLSMLKMITWSCVVLDEAQNIKNPSSERAKSVKALNRNTGIAVTGTPFENHVTDIWSLVDFVVPGLLGELNTFKHNVSDDVLGAQKVEPLLTPIMIRRLVKDVANDLPEKIVIPQPIEMSDLERTEYDRYKADARNEVENGTAVSLAILQKLRMFCTHQTLCSDRVLIDPYVSSVKYQRFCEIVEEIIARKEKVLVFTSYKKMFDIFKDDIPKRFGIELDCIYGEIPVEDRQMIVDRFNNYEGSVMLALNPRAAGTGLNITGANHVIHFNLEWNPSLEDQSSARAYRRGQKKTVFVYRLFYIDSVEQIINERIERKRAIASTAVVGIDGISDKTDILRALELSPDFSVKGKTK